MPIPNGPLRAATARPTSTEATTSVQLRTLEGCSSLSTAGWRTRISTAPAALLVTERRLLLVDHQHVRALPNRNFNNPQWVR
jgi:hypothetical protein